MLVVLGDRRCGVAQIFRSAPASCYVLLIPYVAVGPKPDLRGAAQPEQLTILDKLHYLA